MVGVPPGWYLWAMSISDIALAFAGAAILGIGLAGQVLALRTGRHPRSIER